MRKGEKRSVVLCGHVLLVVVLSLVIVPITVIFLRAGSISEPSKLLSILHGIGNA